MRDRSQVDVVVVGAGAAGLAATRTARELGLDVLTLEAMDRIGGRAFTDSRPFGFPWDAGCHWLHSASSNPFTRFADESGFHYRSTSVPWNSWIDGAPTTAQEEDAVDAFINATLDAATRCGQEGIDIPVADLVDPDSPWLDIFRCQINAEWGVDPRAASTLDLARYRDTGENWPIEEGYGALVARVAGDAVSDVRLNTVVESIDWSGLGVRVTTSEGSVDAAAVIITASTAVLNDGVIGFDPPLPIWKQEAFAAVPLGRANKIAFQPEPGVLAELEEQSVTVPIGANQMIGLRLRPFGRNLVDGYVGGPVCVELEAAGDAAMIDAGLEALATVLGSDARRHVTATAISQWASEPYIRGAYAAAVPSQAERRADLARPLADRLYFAGEATSPEFFTTCHGAWETGVAAAQVAAGQRKRAGAASE